MANQFTVQGTPVFIAADPNTKKVSVFGDAVVYGDQGVNHGNAAGKIEEGKPVNFGKGQWFVSEGSSLLTVQEVDEKADVKPDEEPKAKAKARKR